MDISKPIPALKLGQRGHTVHPEQVWESLRHQSKGPFLAAEAGSRAHSLAPGSLAARAVLERLKRQEGKRQSRFSISKNT